MDIESEQTDAARHAELCTCLKQLAEGDLAARERIFELCNERFRTLASRLLGRFSRVRRWDTTGDVAQNASIRLHRALAEVVPASPRGLMGLMAAQIQRELIDLARKHAGPMSFAANHDTGASRREDGPDAFVDTLPAREEETIPLERWERFHRAVEDLPDDLREVFRMAWYMGLDQNAVAGFLGCSVRTVGRKWQEAQHRLQAVLGDNTA